jgi:hypothetical protein
VNSDETLKLFEALRACRPEFAESLQARLNRNDPPGPDMEIVIARDNCATIRLSGRLVHSAVAPQREADRLIANLTESPPDGAVLFGMGLGYHLIALRRDHPRLCVAVVEPDSVILRRVLDHHPPEWWCRYGPDIVVAPDDQDALVSFLRRNGVYQPYFIALQGIASHYVKESRTTETLVRQYRQRRTVNRNTLRRFGKLWVRNTLRNLVGGIPRRGIELLQQSLPGVPAVVCGAGPTLDEIISFLPALRERCLIVAVDTATPVLQRVGVDPHIVVVSDPQYWNTRHMDHVRSEAGPTSGNTTVLVAEPATHPRIFRMWQGAGLVAASLFPIGEFIDQRLGRLHKLGAGGSVATSAWDLARFLGATRIYLAGIDLGFPFSRTHCRGSFFEERIIRNADRLHPAEQGLFRYLYDADPVPVPSAGGGNVLSDARMEVYRSWFAEQARRDTDIKTTLLSPESSRIENVSVENPVHVIRAHRPREISLNLLPESSTPTVNNPTNEAVSGPGLIEQQITADLRKSIVEIQAIAEEALSVCDILQKHDQPGNEVLAALDTLDQKLAACTDRELAGFLSQEAVEQATTFSVRSVGDAIEQARRIYSALDDSCRYHRKLLNKYVQQSDQPPR